MKDFSTYQARNALELSQFSPVAKSLQSIELSTITDLTELSRFTSLKHLKVYAMSLIELYEDNLIDTSTLSCLPNLQSFVLENDDHVRELCLRNKKELKTLSITSCHNLRTISGLKSLTNLQELVIYDTPNIDLDFLTSLVEFINEHPNLNRIVLDINFFNFFNESQLEILRYNGVCFAEKIGIRDNYIFSFNMMKEYNKRILKVYEEIHSRCKKSDDILFAIYEYVKNTDYDDESLLNRHKYLENGGKIYRFDNRYKSVNSSYSALIRKKAVCEGYVNLLKYFYKLEGVDLYPVICEYKEQSHVAAKALINGIELYFDPELDHRFNNHNNYGISKDEFLRNHDISFYRDNFDHLSTNSGDARKR